MDFKQHRKWVKEENQRRKLIGLDQMPKLTVSFSGGRTSAVMTKRLWEERKDTHDIIIVFANTGCEHEATLDFVNECATRFGWPLVWVEAVINQEKGKGVRHRVVNYETASRDGGPFEDSVKKYGIYNQTHPSCTTRLKEEPMNSLRSKYGFLAGKKLNHQTAIGIRADEIDRVSLNGMKYRGFIYPMVDWNYNKRSVGLEIAKWGFDLKIPGDHYGNCTWCWKKSLRKHLTLAKECPSVFDFPEKMEKLYGQVKEGHKNGDENGRAWWFRNHMSVADIKEMARTRLFRPYTDDAYEHGWEQGLDFGGSCGESCEIGADID